MHLLLCRDGFHFCICHFDCYFRICRRHVQKQRCHVLRLCVECVPLLVHPLLHQQTVVFNVFQEYVNRQMNSSQKGVNFYMYKYHSYRMIFIGSSATFNIFPNRKKADSTQLLKQLKQSKWESRFSVCIQCQIGGNCRFHCKLIRVSKSGR